MRKFYQHFHRVWPYWFFFCDLRTETLTMMTLSLMPNLSGYKHLGEPKCEEDRMIWFWFVETWRSWWLGGSNSKGFRLVGGSWWVVGTGLVGEEGASVLRVLPLGLDLRGWPKEVRAGRKCKTV